MVRWCWVNFQCRGVLLIVIVVGQGPTALSVGAGGGCLDIFSLIYHFFLLSPSSDVQALTEKAFTKITASDWQWAVDHVVDVKET